MGPVYRIKNLTNSASCSWWNDWLESYLWRREGIETGGQTYFDLHSNWQGYLQTICLGWVSMHWSEMREIRRKKLNRVRRSHRTPWNIPRNTIENIESFFFQKCWTEPNHTHFWYLSKNCWNNLNRSIKLKFITLWTSSRTIISFLNILLVTILDPFFSNNCIVSI